MWRDRIPLRLRRSRWWGFGHDVRSDGLGFTLTRHRTWRKILRSSPVRTQAPHSHADREIHLMCREQDYLSAVWALKSFYRVSAADFPLVIHFQGAMSPLAYRTLSAHFPDSLLVSQAEADRLVEAQLKGRGFRHLLDARRHSPIMMKLTDVMLTGRSSCILYIDSDVLFFQYPAELVAGTPGETSFFMRCVGNAYTVSREEAASKLGVSLPPCANAGLMLFQREHVRLDRCEWFLAQLAVPHYGGLIEQTLYVLCASERGQLRYLPESYIISMQPGIAGHTVARHYAGPSRHLLTTEGMPRLLRDGLLKEQPREADNLSVLESKKPH